MNLPPDAEINVIHYTDDGQDAAFNNWPIKWCTGFTDDNGRVTIELRTQHFNGLRGFPNAV